MQPSPDGLVPMTGFLQNAMAPRPSFNDASSPGKCSWFKGTSLLGQKTTRLAEIRKR